MSRSYVPPSRRQKAPIQKIGVEINNLNDFPSLSASGPKTRFLPTKSFAALASEWDERAKEEKDQAEQRKAIANQEKEQMEIRRMNIVQHKPVEFLEPDYDDEGEAAPLIVEKDEWTTINHTKIRRELTVEEKYLRDQRLAEEERQAEQGNTFWTENSDWDYRDRRTYT